MMARGRCVAPPRLRRHMHRPQFQPLFWLFVLGASAVTGLIYERLFGPGDPLVAAVYGVFIGAPVLAFETGRLFPGWRRLLRRLPTVPALLGAEATYVALITAGHGVAGVLLVGLGRVTEPMLEAALPSARVLLYSLAASAVLVSVVRIRDLIGSQIFFSLLVGRYHKPVREERVFLFVDVVGSTRFAETHGDLRAQEFLGTFFAALAEPVRTHGGSMDDYVGDLALITWPLARGIRDGRCVACVFAIEDAIARNAGAWEESFGLVPRFRAALHGGSVVTAEVGVDRHKIAYFGDTVNATARLEALCRELDLPVLISTDLLDRILSLPQGVGAERLGEHAVRGRATPLSVAVLRKGWAESRRPLEPGPVRAPAPETVS